MSDRLHEEVAQLRALWGAMMEARISIISQFVDAAATDAEKNGIRMFSLAYLAMNSKGHNIYALDWEEEVAYIDEQQMIGFPSLEAFLWYESFEHRSPDTIERFRIAFAQRTGSEIPAHFQDEWKRDDFAAFYANWS